MSRRIKEWAYAAQQLSALAERWETLAGRYAGEAALTESCASSRYLTGLAKATTDCAQAARARAAELGGSGEHSS